MAANPSASIAPAMATERRAGRTFTYEEALNTLPLVRGLTDAAVRRVEALLNEVKSREEMENRREELTGAYDLIVQAWTQEIVALGCEVKGLWLVDWDSGSGYYCWRYPEASIGYFHSYEDGFAGRIPVA